MTERTQTETPTERARRLAGQAPENHLCEASTAMAEALLYILDWRRGPEWTPDTARDLAIAALHRAGVKYEPRPEADGGEA